MVKYYSSTSSCIQVLIIVVVDLQSSRSCKSVTAVGCGVVTIGIPVKVNVVDSPQLEVVSEGFKTSVVVNVEYIISCSGARARGTIECSNRCTYDRHETASAAILILINKYNIIIK